VKVAFAKVKDEIWAEKMCVNFLVKWGESWEF